MTYAGMWTIPPVPRGWAHAISVLASTISLARPSNSSPFSYNTWLTDFMFVSLLFCVMAFMEYGCQLWDDRRPEA